MNTLSLEGWCKAQGAGRSEAIGLIHFRVPELAHQELELAEESMARGGEAEMMLEVNMAEMELETPEGVGPLSDCRLRIYINEDDQRGHFHLMGHRASDGSLVYTNAVMVDQLG